MPVPDLGAWRWTGLIALLTRAMTAASQVKRDDTYTTQKSISKGGAWTDGYDGCKTPSSGSRESNGSLPPNDQCRLMCRSPQGTGNWSCGGEIWNSQWWYFAYGVWKPTLMMSHRGLQDLLRYTTTEAQALTFEILRSAVTTCGKQSQAVPDVTGLTLMTTATEVTGQERHTPYKRPRNEQCRPFKELKHKCDICEQPARVPYRNCNFCGKAPSYHHGRCCPSNPGRRANPRLSDEVMAEGLDRNPLLFSAIHRDDIEDFERHVERIRRRFRNWSDRQ